MDRKIKGVILSQPGIIDTPKGEVIKVIKKSDEGYKGFGEAYFSSINKGMIKGLKLHSRMTSNLIVIEGKVTFILLDQRNDSPTVNLIEKYYLSRQDYMRLTIPPGIVYGFKGNSDFNLILNIADLEHEPSESRNIDLYSGLIPLDLWKE